MWAYWQTRLRADNLFSVQPMPSQTNLQGNSIGDWDKVSLTGIYCTFVFIYFPAVEGGDEDEGEHEEEDGGDDHHDQRDLGLGQVLIWGESIDSELLWNIYSAC